MRHIDRLDTPEVLKKKQTQWEAKYKTKLATSPNSRPDPSKYAHDEIRNQLKTMSHCKCFYCEGILKDLQSEVDHYIEVACDRTKAYQWENLYLGCNNCNKKVPHNKIPVTDALDPCSDSDATIKDNITFENEVIQAVPESPKGLKTIIKFRLNSELLDTQRAKWLNHIYAKVVEILLNLKNERRDNMTEEERNKLLQFMQPTSKFSLMSEIFIKKLLPEFFH